MMIFLNTLFLLYFLPLSVLGKTTVPSNNTKLAKNKITLTVAVEGSGYFPFNYMENGQMKGFSVDILDYITTNSTYNFTFITRPWPRALSQLAQGKVDLIITLFKSSKRDKIYHIIEPAYGFEANQLFTRTHTNLKFSGQLKQLTPYSIGTKRAYSYGKSFDQADYLHKYPALTEEVLLKMLLGNRVDAIIGNPFMFEKIAKKNNITDQIKAITPYVSLTPVHIALTKVRPDSQEIKKTLEQLIKQLKSSSYYQELLSKYQLDFK